MNQPATAPLFHYLRNGALSPRHFSPSILAAVTAWVALAVFAASGAGPAHAQSWFGESVIISGERQNQQFAAGEHVRVSANVTDDVFALTRELTVENASMHSLIAAAGTLTVTGGTARDIIAAGLEMEIAGTVEDDVVAAVCPVCWWRSGRMRIANEARIGDDAVLLAGDLDVDGTIEGDLRAMARRIVIAGTIAGDVRLRANEIVVSSGASIGGELIARSASPPQIASDATITGGVQRIETEFRMPEPETLGTSMVWFAILAALAFVLGIALLAIFTVLLLPGLVRAGADSIHEETWATIGYGLVWMLVLPALVALLMAVVVGIPSALVLMALLCVLLTISFVTAAYALGLWIRERWRKPEQPPSRGGRIGWMLLGLLILAIAGLVPLVGWIVVFLALLAGLGSVIRRLWRGVQAA